jgi:CO dehydrogenase/acetyl-CoA synthase delta subunit
VTSSRITGVDRLIHALARAGVRRNEWRVSPGLYRLGAAGPDSPVFVSANYKLSFDALREALDGIDCYIMVLDTKGINVWCAAGKRTFGTDEVVYRIERTGLAEVVEHRRLILPQLSATGVAAHEVRERSGFRVTYGPVRASDIKEFMESGKASDEMRLVRFDLKDRAVLIPVEAKSALPIALGASTLAALAGDPVAAAGITAASFAGFAGVPALLPWLPGEDFSVKGFALGGLVALAAAIAALRDDGSSMGIRLLRATSYALLLPPISAFASLNFTGCSTYTSPTGVRKEIDTYVRLMAGMAASGFIMYVAQRVARAAKG